MSALDDLLANAPELVNSPSLAASAVGVPGDLGQSGQVLSHADTVTNIAKHEDNHPGILGAIGSFFSNDIVHPLKVVGQKVLDALAAPIGDVQHDYRYFHDVVDKHGGMAGIAALIPGILGATGGALLGGPAGALLGGAAAENISRRFIYADSAARTAPHDYRDSSGALVNPGQDLADVVDHVINGHNYQANKHVDMPTGIANAVFDLFLDPTLGAAKLAEAAKFAKYGVDLKSADVAAGIGANKAARGAVAEALSKGMDASAITVPADRVSEIFQQPKVRQMAQILADSSTEDVLSKFPRLAPLAGDLGKAKTVDEVADVYRDALTAKNGGVLSRGLPTTALTKMPMAIAAARNAILNAGSRDAIEHVTDEAGNVVPKIDPATGLPQKLYMRDAHDNLILDAEGNPRAVQKANSFVRTLTAYRPFNISDDFKRFSSHEMDPTDDGAADTLYQVAKLTQNRRTALAWKAQFLATESPAQRVNLWKNAHLNTIRALGVPDGHPALQAITGEIADAMDATARPVYGLDEFRQPISVPTASGETRNVGLLRNQTGTMTFPDYQKMRDLQRELRSSNVFGRVVNQVGHADDWVNDHITRMFKSLVLLSGGFALRVATGELVPATIAAGSAITRGTLGLAVDALNPSIKHMVGEENLSLVGKRAETADRAVSGKIVAHSADGATVKIKGAQGVTEHPSSDVLLNHDDIDSFSLRKLAKEQGFDFDGGDIKHLVASSRMAMYGWARPLVDEKALENVHLTQMNLDGHHAPTVLLADHGHSYITDGASSYRAFTKAARLAAAPDKKLGTDFRIYDGLDEHHSMFWNFALKEAANDPAFVKGTQAYQEALRATGDREAAHQAFVGADREAMSADPGYRRKMAGADDLTAYAGARGKLLRGLIIGPDGTLHENVLENLTRGEATDYRTLDDVGVGSRPAVKGRELTDAPLPSDQSLLNHLVTAGYRRVIDPIINGMSRKPIFNSLVYDEYKNLQGVVDAGLMTKQQANMLAIQRAVPKMLPLVHNTEFRSQFSELARNFMPFYFAQEQAYKRYAKAVLTDPIAFERARLAAHGLSNSGIMQKDDAGQGYVVLPLLGRSGSWVTAAAGMLGIGVQGGIPSVISGNVQSLKSVIPEANLPGISPLASIALKDIERVFPATEPFLHPVVGDIAESQSALEQLIPNAALRTALQATPLLDNQKAFHSAFLYAIQNAARRSEELRRQAETVGAATDQGKRLLAEADKYLPDPTNPDPLARQEAVNRIKSTTRLMFLVKAAFNMTSPLSPKLDVGDVGLRKEFTDEIKKHNGDIALGVQAFLDKHPAATADTVFQSDNKFTNTSIPSGDAAFAFTQANRAFIKAHPLAAAYLMPQDNTKINLQAYNEQVALGLRQRRTPDEYVNALYSASTNVKYYDALREKKQMEASSDPYQKQQIDSAFGQYTNQLAAANPIWYAQLKDPRGQETAHFALQDLRQVLSSGKAPDSPQMGVIKELINSYDQFAAREAALRSTGQSVRSLNSSWSDFLTGYADQHPEASAVVNGVFRKLPKYEQSADSQTA